MVMVVVVGSVVVVKMRTPLNVVMMMTNGNVYNGVAVGDGGGIEGGKYCAGGYGGGYIAVYRDDSVYGRVIVFEKKLLSTYIDSKT